MEEEAAAAGRQNALELELKRTSWRSYETPPSQSQLSRASPPGRDRSMERSVIEYINLSPRHAMHSSQRALLINIHKHYIIQCIICNTVCTYR